MRCQNINLTKLLVRAVTALSIIIKTSINPQDLYTILVVEIGFVTIKMMVPQFKSRSRLVIGRIIS